MRIRSDPSLMPHDYPFSQQIRVRFAETDAMGIVHHAAYMPYLEVGRVEYLRSIDRPYAALRDEGVDFAVVEAYLRYVRPLRFDDLVDVHVRLASATRATFQMSYLLTVDGETMATGVTVHSAVDQRGRPIRLPQWLAQLSASNPD